MFEAFELVKVVVREAGKAVLAHYDSNFDVLYKDDSQPLTQADLVSERVIIHGLSRFGYPILSEETEDDISRLRSEMVFIVDPLDGTKEFIDKNGEFSVMIALVERGRPMFGVIYWPVRGELYYAMKGEGAYLRKGDTVRRLKVSNNQELSEYRMLMSRSHLLKMEEDFASKFCIRNLIPHGSAGCKSCLIARGDADLYLNTSNKTYEWDVCAADIIVSEAGGRVTDMDGERIFYNKENPKNLNGFIVSNGKKHDRIVETLNNFRK